VFRGQIKNAKVISLTPGFNPVFFPHQAQNHTLPLKFHPLAFDICILILYTFPESRRSSGSLLDEIEYHFDKIDIKNCRKIPAFTGVTATALPIHRHSGEERILVVVEWLVVSGNYAARTDYYSPLHHLPLTHHPDSLRTD
jgi:hypothetical protein